MRAPLSRSVILRLGLFGALFLGGTAAHFFTRPLVGPFINVVLNARPAAQVIDLLLPSEGVRATGSRVGSANTWVQVAQGCEGVDVMLMVVAALLAFPMAARRKALGVALAVLLIYALNVSRIVGLWFCLRHWPASFDSMHLVVGQTALIIAGVGFFAAWSGVLRGARA
ncbi:MAG: exosortase/archaeosortase family protein [Myxococcota bacterium]